jgi:uncharacterized repeat protein (TIGR03803 family)
MKTHKARAFLRVAVLLAVVVVSGAVLAEAQTLTTIHSFTGANGDGEYPFPYGRLPFDNNGALYGTTAGGGTGYNGTVYQLMPPTVPGGAWTENVLYRFAGGADGRQPSMGVVFDQIGNLYGTTQYGGNAQMCGGGCGTIFKLSPPTQPGGPWTHTVLYTFQGNADGQYPGEMLFGANGVLYGTTVSGGANPGVLCHSNYRIKFGCGTVFEFTPPAENGGAWNKTVLYTFPGFKGDGTGPGSEITFDSQGNIYGLTGSGTAGYGTVFQLTRPSTTGGAWKETVLHDFTGGSDGGYPAGTVTLGPNGVLYGAASYSGIANASGVIYQLTPPEQPGGAWTETVLHTFPAFKGDATTPFTTLAIDPGGNLYGTSVFGGSSACYLGCGTIFKLAPPSGGGPWTETVLHDLGNSRQNPNGSLVLFHNGLLYGTTTYLGASDVGSVFTLVP